MGVGVHSRSRLSELEALAFADSSSDDDDDVDNVASVPSPLAAPGGHGQDPGSASRNSEQSASCKTLSQEVEDMPHAKPGQNIESRPVSCGKPATTVKVPAKPVDEPHSKARDSKANREEASSSAGVPRVPKPAGALAPYFNGFKNLEQIFTWFSTHGPDEQVV